MQVKSKEASSTSSSKGGRSWPKQGRGNTNNRRREVIDEEYLKNAPIRGQKNGGKQKFRPRGEFDNEEPKYHKPTEFKNSKKQSAADANIASITEVDLQSLQSDELHNRFKQCRKAFSSLQSKSNHVFCHDLRYVRIRQFFMSATEALIARLPELAVQKQVVAKIWSALNKEIRSADHTNNLGDDDGEQEEEEEEDDDDTYDNGNTLSPDVVSEVTNLLTEDFDYFMKILKTLFATYSPLKRPNHSEESSRQLCGHLLLILGDLERYKAKYSQTNDLSKAQEFYNKSHSLYPFNGKTCNQMAVVSGMKDDLFGSIYWLIRSLSTEKKFQCRETLNKYFEKVRLEFMDKFREIEAVSAGKMAPQTSDDSEKIFMNFCFTFLRMQGIFFTKIGEEEVEKTSYLLSSQLHNFTRFTKNLTNDDLRRKNINRLVHIMIISLFSLHNSVLGTDSLQDVDTSFTEETIEGSPYGKHALGQFCQLFVHLTNAVDSAVDYWLVALTPLMYWLFSHQEVIPYLLQKYPETKRSFSKLLKLVKKYQFEQTFDNVKGREVLVADLSQHDVFLHQILQGGLSEDLNFIGFMPLQKLFGTLKPQATTKYDNDSLPEARARIFQLVLEKVCAFFDNDSKPSSDNDEELSNEELDLEDLPEGLDVVGIHSKLASSGKTKGPLIILDGPNVAIQHGETYFSSKGLKLAIEYWTQRGYDVIAFLPENCLSYEKVAAYKRAAKASHEISKAKMPDNVGMLIELKRQGYIATTPAQDYDDSYCIKYAKEHAGCIVTNDRYMDHVANQPENMRGITRKWVRSHCISFTYVGDELIPNPDFQFPE